MRSRTFAVAALALGGVVLACYKTPESVRLFAAGLPERADGVYAGIDLDARKMVVLNDALLQCKIDLEDGKAESDSAACRCSRSASADWTADCKDWLGVHTPVATPEPAAADAGAANLPEAGI